VARDYNFWVYIMTNKHHTVLYIGMTDDLVRRVSEHCVGEIPGFTTSYRCKRLVYYEHCTDVLAAITREKQLKRWSRSKKIALTARMNPHWRDLAREVLGEEQQPAVI
jgi:putative endonuclease